ncbi:MAG: hypothetical protein L0Z50_32195 [Verrucomicrobiales bacterium]|nr:hypothetical protein [Verrucomicrobiales bacterium]
MITSDAYATSFDMILSTMVQKSSKFAAERRMNRFQADRRLHGNTGNFLAWDSTIPVLWTHSLVDPLT